MTSLSDGDVRQSDVIRWAQEQAIYLSPPSAHHVLLYLCLNAFYTGSNPEGKGPGNVMTGRTRLRTIRRYTGLGRATIQRALDILQDNGYVLVSMEGGRGDNQICVAWSEAMDRVREEFRAGHSDLPKIFRREVAPAPVQEDAQVLEFRPRPVTN